MSTTATPAPETAQPPTAPTAPETALPPNGGQALAPAQPKAPPAPVDFDPDDPVSLYMDTGVFGQLQRVATMMASSALVPDYLKQKVADCALIAAQAFRWRMDPFAVAQCSYALRGKLGYEGKLIAALVNSNRKMASNLDYIYTGTKGTKTRTVKVVGQLRAENKERSVEGSVEEWATENEQWKKDPDQMLAYRGAREWARRHLPEVMLGIQSVDEVQTIDMTREPSGRLVAPASLDALTDKLSAPAAPAAAVTDQPSIPVPAEVIPPPPAAPARDPGSDDDDPAPTTAAAAAESKGPFGKAVEDEKKRRGQSRIQPE